MEISVSSQTMAFLLSCLLGAGLAAVYDVFRILRIALPQPAPVIAAQDFAYLLICAGATFFYLMTTVSGQIRLFVLVGEVIGWVLYYFTIGEVVMKAAHTVIDFVYRLLRLLAWPHLSLWESGCTGFEPRGQKSGGKGKNFDEWENALETTEAFIV